MLSRLHAIAVFQLLIIILLQYIRPCITCNQNIIYQFIQNITSINFQPSLRQEILIISKIIYFSLKYSIKKTFLFWRPIFCRGKLGQGLFFNKQFNSIYLPTNYNINKVASILLYIGHYMQSIDKLLLLSQYFGNNRLTIESLLQIRDQLLLSLVSELAFNKQLIAKTFTSHEQFLCFNDQLKPQQLPSQLKVNGEDREHVHKYIPQIRKKRKLIRRSPKISSSYFQLKNDTKNIPKNYGKAILNYILKSSSTSRAASLLGLNYSQFLIHIRKMKNKINSIDGLRKMWGADNIDNKTKKCIRILSYQFMRKHCLRYIFCSKVRNFATHIKYRQKLIEGIEDPLSFSHIKDY